MPPRPLSLTEGLQHKELDRIARACAYAEQHLAEMRRRSGEDYSSHGCEVAATLREMTKSHELLSVAILHDILMHPEGRVLLADAPLSDKEKKLVREMHELRRLHIDANTDDLDRVIEAFAESREILLLRMAHRFNDVRHLERFGRDLQKQIASETLHMYTAIAGRLGIHSWRYEMEDICFRHLHPKAAISLQQKFWAMEKVDRACLDHAQRYLSEALKSEGIPARISGRIKSLYSTYRKMIVKQRQFEELTDRLALRIIVPDTQDCYRALGVVHARMHPVPGKLKDYCGAPKENGYRSIHSVVYPLAGITEQPIEIQIRSEAMDRECKQGFASHTTYKERLSALSATAARVNLFRNLRLLRQEARSPEQFEQTLRTYFREDHIALFDGDNNLYHLRKPATALDLLCVSAPRRISKLKTISINGRTQAPDTVLRDGDTVVGHFARTNTIHPDWVSACRHSASRAVLRKLLEALRIIRGLRPTATRPARRPRAHARRSPRARAPARLPYDG